MSNYPKKKSSIKGSLVSRQQMKELLNLTEDLHKSRIAVEHIRKNRQEQNQSISMVEEIKNDLKKCILMIKTQERKQIVLKQLVAVLNGEMSQIQTKQQQIKEKEQIQLEKNVKQMRDDIDKIFEKKNHEVAKIVELKDKANQCRSQRVVFSNLFKKIEKQLKQHQQIYKNQILKAENNKINFENSQKYKSKLSHYTKSSKISDFSAIYPKTHKRQSYLLGQPRSKMQTSAFPEDLDESTSLPFKQQSLNINIRSVEIQIEKKQKGFEKKRENHKQQLQKSRNHKSTRIEKVDSSKDVIGNFETFIDGLTKFIDRIKTACGVASAYEIVELMETVQEQNCKIKDDIESINEQIQKYHHRTEEIGENLYKQNIKQEHFDEFDQTQAIKSTMLGFKYREQAKEKRQRKYHNLEIKSGLCNNQSALKNQQQLIQICKILNMNLSLDELEEGYENSANLPYQIKNFNSLQFQKKCYQIDQAIDRILITADLDNSQEESSQKHRYCLSLYQKTNFSPTQKIERDLQVVHKQSNSNSLWHQNSDCKKKMQTTQMCCPLSIRQS